MKLNSGLLLIGFLFVLTFIIFGCTGTYSQAYAQQYVLSAQNRVQSNDENSLVCKTGTCWCMVCQNGTGFVGTSFLRSLVGGRCWFDQDCTPAKLLLYASGGYSNDVRPRQFMIGQGTSASDFSQANGYCNDKLSMSVNWLVGNKANAYSMPDPSVATCFLRQDIMPVYVLYSNSQNINPTQAGQIALKLYQGGPGSTGSGTTGGPVGPVIIVTEMNYNDTPTNIAAIANEVYQINQQCGNVRTNAPNTPPSIHCMVAVGPKMNDSGSLADLMNYPYPGGSGTVSQYVDLVAFGIDNDFITGCDGGSAMLAAENFSSYVISTYNKPTIIPYIKFDAQGQDLAADLNPGGANPALPTGCNWTESGMIDAYSKFLPLGASTLMSDGVIGISPYTFNSSGSDSITNPLNCKDCDLGVNSARLTSWFGGCQAYTRVVDSTSGNYQSLGSIIHFSNASGTSCDSGTDLESMFQGMTFGNGADSLDILNPQPVALSTADNPFISCSSCVDNAFSGSPFVFGTYTNTHTSAPSYLSPTDQTTAANPNNPNHNYCYAYPELDAAANQRGLDPMYVRAFVLGESDFNHCSVAKVCSAAYKAQTHDPTCFAPNTPGDDECYGMGYNIMSDPDYTGAAGDTGAGDSACPSSDFTPAPNVDSTTGVYSGPAGTTPEWRFCALGLMQVLEPPYTFWPQADVPATISPSYTDASGNGLYWNAYQDTNRVVSPSGTLVGGMPGSQLTGSPPSSSALLTGPATCSPFFNPFNASQNVCWGTKKLQSNLLAATQRVQQYHAANELPWTSASPGGAEKDSVFAAYIAANMYSGIWDQPASAALSSRQTNADCAGLSLGNCWIKMFSLAWPHTDASCTAVDSTGHVYNPNPTYCSAAGVVNTVDSAGYQACYGQQDPIQYIDDCELQHMVAGYKTDRGAGKMDRYYQLRDLCPNSACPTGRQLLGATSTPIPTTGSTTGTSGASGTSGTGASGSSTTTVAPSLSTFDQPVPSTLAPPTPTAGTSTSGTSGTGSTSGTTTTPGTP